MKWKNSHIYRFIDGMKWYHSVWKKVNDTYWNYFFLSDYFYGIDMYKLSHKDKWEFNTLFNPFFLGVKNGFSLIYPHVPKGRGNPIMWIYRWRDIIRDCDINRRYLYIMRYISKYLGKENFTYVMIFEIVFTSSQYFYYESSLASLFGIDGEVGRIFSPISEKKMMITLYSKKYIPHGSMEYEKLKKFIMSKEDRGRCILEKL